MFPVGRNIKLIRKQKKITQSDLAQNLNISKTYLSLIETGKKIPSLDIIYKVSQALDVDPGAIVTYDETFVKIQNILKNGDLSGVLSGLSEIAEKLMDRPEKTI